MTLLDLPAHLRTRYQTMAPEHQAKIEARMRAVAELSLAPRSAWESTAERLSRHLTAEHGRGFSKKRLLDLFRAYRQAGPSALLVAYGESDAKPREFLDELARRVGDNKRVASVAFARLHADWYAGVSILGYGTWRDHWRATHGEGEPAPEHCPDWFLPKGWDERNLRRLLPGEAQITLDRHGYFAAHGRLPQKRNDYSALQPLQIVVFDDVRCDFMVYHPGTDRAVEMWMLVAMDAASRLVLDWVSLVRVPDDAGKRAEFLGEHMLILVGNILRRYGVPSGYSMTLKVENAKATISREKADYLRTLAGGQIEVDYTVMSNRALPGGRAERHGTPWDVKGILESFFGNLHNHNAALPGQIGARYDLAPGELKDRQDELTALARECEDLPPAVMESLRLPFLRSSEAVEAIQRTFDHIADSSRHTLQGFDKIDLWRFPEDTAWRPLEELRRYGRADIARAIFETRRESRRQRFERLMRAAKPFVPVPGEALIPFVARTVKRVRHPAPQTIAWSVDDVLWTFRGEGIPALDGTRKGGDFFVRYLPDELHAAWLYDAETGRQLGLLRRVNLARVGDEDSQARALGELARARAAVVGPVMERRAAEREAKVETDRLNASIIEAARAGGTMREQAAESTRATKAESKAAADQNAARARQMAERARRQRAADAAL